MSMKNDEISKEEYRLFLAENRAYLEDKKKKDMELGKEYLPESTILGRMGRMVHINHMNLSQYEDEND